MILDFGRGTARHGTALREYLAELLINYQRALAAATRSGRDADSVITEKRLQIEVGGVLGQVRRCLPQLRSSAPPQLPFPISLRHAVSD